MNAASTVTLCWPELRASRSDHVLSAGTSALPYGGWSSSELPCEKTGASGGDGSRARASVSVGAGAGSRGDGAPELSDASQSLSRLPGSMGGTRFGSGGERRDEDEGWCVHT